MALLVQKFGGTSVGSIERIEAVAELIVRHKQQGHQVVAVVSAMAGETNRLVSLAQQIDTQPSAREQDVLLTTGEQVSAALLAMALIKRGYPAVSLVADQAGIVSDNMFGKAQITQIDPKRLHQELEHGRIAIITGFQARDHEGNITTLGRGGSDTSAVAIAGAINADECQIYTDVNGVYTTDPRIEPNAKRISQITFNEMLAMASLGAKVLHSRAVEAGAANHMPLRVLSSFTPDEGTLISENYANGITPSAIAGIAFSQHETLVTLQGLQNEPHILSAITTALYTVGVEIDMLQQQPLQALSFSLPNADLDTALEVFGTLACLGGVKVNVAPNMAKLSVVGQTITSPVQQAFFRTLEEENIPTHLSHNTPHALSVLVARKYLELGVRALHNKLLIKPKLS